MNVTAVTGPAIRPIIPEGVPVPKMRYSPAIQAGSWVFASGQLATDFVNGLAAEARVNPELPFHSDAMELEARYIIPNLAATIKAAGGDFAEDLVRIYQWFVAPEQDWRSGDAWTGIVVGRYLRELSKYMPQGSPASTAMGIRKLLTNNATTEVDFIARLPVPGEVRCRIPFPPDVPAPMAKYAPAVQSGDWMFTCGEVPVDWTGDFMTEGPRMGNPDQLGSLAPEARSNPYHWYDAPIWKQTEYTLNKLQTLIESAGASLDRCVRAEVYLADPGDFYGMDEVWRTYFPKNPPARVVIPYMGLTGRGCKVEIALTLVMPGSDLEIRTIETSEAPEPRSWEPQAVRAGDLLFLSSQMAVNEKGIPRQVQRDPNYPYYAQPAKLQMEYVLDNVTAICEAAGTSIENVVHRQCFHSDFNDFAPSYEAWAGRFPQVAPASTTIEVGGPLLVPGCLFSMNLIAYVPGGA